MKKFLIYLSLNFGLLSCKTDKSNEIATAKLVYDTQIEEVKRSYQYMRKSISDAGNREKDLDLLYRVDSLQLLRRLSGLKYTNLEYTLDLKYERVINFIRELEDHVEAPYNKKSISELLDRSEYFLADYQKTNSKLQLLNFLINISQAEIVVLNEYERRMPYSCGIFFSLNFNLHTNSDSVEINSPIKMMIALKPDVTECLWDIKIDSLVLSRNDTVIYDSFKFESIGGVGYFEYLAKDPGTYTISGNYKMTYRTEEHTFQEKFTKTFTVYTVQ
ncbi:MAG: hypothetical protein ABJF11_15295 [Reichenbachiella sp.]|uniref:hypothetical protein n=1 Tax=Reichenbachiella sp. TaxID=2184521 RepID=UPI003263371E